MVIEWSLRSFERMQAMCLFCEHEQWSSCLASSRSTLENTDERSDNYPVPTAFSLAWGCSETYRGGKWYPENSGSRKFLFQSRNLGGVLNESRNLVFLCFFASRILEFLAARSRSLGFLFFWPTISIKTMIKLFFWLKRTIAVFWICRRDKSGF